MKKNLITFIIYTSIFAVILLGAYLFQKLGGIDALKSLDTSLNEDLNKVINTEGYNDNITHDNISSNKVVEEDNVTVEEVSPDDKIKDYPIYEDTQLNSDGEINYDQLLPYPKRKGTAEELFKKDLAISEKLGVKGKGILPEFEKQSKVGVLLIHGLSSTPKEMEYFSKYVRDAGYSYYNVRLAGHGTSEADLKTKTYKDWYNSIELGYNTLASFCDKIVVIGESNGGILAAAVARFNKVDALVLSAPAFALNPEIFGDGSKDIFRNINSEYFLTYNYNTFPGEAIKQVNILGELAGQYLKEINIPVLLAISEKDIAVNSKKAIDIYLSLKNPHKDLFLYNNEEYGISHVLLAEEFKSINVDIMNWIKSNIEEK